MSGHVSRRRFLLGSLAAAAGLAGCTGRDAEPSTSAGGGAPSPPASTSAEPVACDAVATAVGPDAPLWKQAIGRGLVYGSSTATWQLSDAEFRRLYRRQATILFTEDDLLWYRLRPTPKADLDFSYGDQIVRFAEEEGMLVLGAHLVWDEGFGDGWTDDDLWGIDEERARDLLFGTVEAVADHYRGRVAAWIVANEVVDTGGIRTNVPWYQTIGPSYVPEAFDIVHAADPDALLLINDYGFETDDEGASAADKRAALLAFLDQLLKADAPVQGVGIQAHLHAASFADAFDGVAYRDFLAAVVDSDLTVLVTEMDVLDDGLPADVRERDRAVADVYSRYLDVALDEPGVASLITFGVSDRYTWLQEDYPREDGAARRPLPFDDGLRPKPAYEALAATLQDAPRRDLLWLPPRC